MKRLVFFVLVFTVATIAAGFDLDKDMALSKANQNFRALAAEALEKGQAEQIAQIERDAAAFADSVGYTKALFHENEVILVRFLERDYAFLADVDSVREFDYSPSVYDRFGDALKAYFKKMKDTGELESAIGQIPNASDRAYARVVIAHCMNVPRQELSEMIEKYTDDLTNENQLRYLVQKYWHKEGFDMETYTCVALGLSYNMMLGDVSKTLDGGIGLNSDFGFNYKNILLEIRIAIEMNDYTGEESANYLGGGFAFDFGMSIPVIANRVFLRPYAGIGIGFNELRWDEENFIDTAYPSFGAGAIADLYLNPSGAMRVGLRLRSGVRTMSAGPRDISSGANFYTELALTVLETRYKEYDFKYPEK